MTNHIDPSNNHPHNNTDYSKNKLDLDIFLPHHQVRLKVYHNLNNNEHLGLSYIFQRWLCYLIFIVYSFLLFTFLLWPGTYKDWNYLIVKGTPILNSRVDFCNKICKTLSPRTSTFLPYHCPTIG